MANKTCDEYAAALLEAANNDVELAFEMLFTAACSGRGERSTRYLAATARELAKAFAVARR